MSDYLIGTDIIGTDWGVPVVMEEKDIGVPVFVDDVTGEIIRDPLAGTSNAFDNDPRLDFDLEPDDIAQIEKDVEKAATEVVGRGGGGGGGRGGGGGGGGGGGRHHGGGGHGHGGFRGGWRGGPGYWGAYPYYDELEPVACVRYDATGNCLEYAPVMDVMGAYDFGVEQPRMDALKIVTVSIAQALLRGGQVAIDGALKGAKQPWYKPDLPGDNSRAIVKGKLQWHATTLASLASTPNAIYASGNDLKHWTLMAFREANSVEAGAQYIGKAWSEMWSEIAAAYKALPAEIRKQIGDAVRIVTGLPVWAWGAIAAGTLAVIGGIIYAFANTKAGAAVAGTVTKAYTRPIG